MSRGRSIDLGDLEELAANPAIDAVRRAAERGIRQLRSEAPPHLELVTPTPEPAPTIRCTDPRTHRVQHRRVNGVWRCEVCRRPDPDHAEPLAEQVAADWDLDGGAA